MLALLGTLACPGAQKLKDKLPEAPAKPVLAGKFANEGCLAMPAADGTTNYTTLAFELSAATWALDAVMYGDETCSAKQGTIHVEGPYTIGNPALAVPGAFEVDFGFSKRTVTPHVDGFIALLQSLSCGKAPYAVNEPQDVLEAGCKDLGFLPAATCAKDHDLVKVEGDGSLHFGKRPADNDMCTADKRPQELGSVLFKLAK